MVRRFHNNRFNIAKLPRQTGKSTTVVAYLMHYALFNDNVNIGILANKAPTAERTSRKVTTCIRELANMVAAGYHCMEQRINGALKMAVKFWHLLHLRLLSEVCRLTSSSSMSSRSFQTILQSNSLALFILLFRLVKAQKSSSSQRRMG